MSACPVCNRRQDDGIMCHSCCVVIETELVDVPNVVIELGVTLARQGRGEVTGKGGLAHERPGYHGGASIAAGVLGNTLTTWARDISGDDWRPKPGEDQTVAAAALLLDQINLARRHAEAKELHEEVVSAIQQGRNATDRAANRTIFAVGPCPEEDEDGTPCSGEVFAFIPTEDDRPSRMECKANPVHKWTSIQWMRTGKRILDVIEKRKQMRGAA